MYKFQEEIKDKPEMIEYKKNNDKLIKTTEKRLLDSYGPKIFSFFGLISTAGSIGTFDFIKDSCNIINDANLDYDYYDDLDGWDYDYDDFEQSSEVLNKKSFEFNLCAYTILSFIHLGRSVHGFYNAYNDLNNIKNRIKGEEGYEEKLKKIIKRFDANKKKNRYTS